MSDISKEGKKQILKQKRQFWYNSKYSAQADIEIAQTLRDDAMLEQAKTLMKRTSIAITKIDDMIAKLEKGGQDG